ncbi:MAG: o-succinylbenzoate synthase [Bryobacteraceae bacterium]
MKIERVRLTHVRIPLVEPFRISNGEVSEKDGIVVELMSEGLVGAGESSPMAGNFYSSDTPEDCWLQLSRELAPQTAGREFTSLDEACAWVNHLPGSNFAKVGIETAFWDLEAQRRGVPLHRLLGGEGDSADSGLAVGLYDTDTQLLAAIEKHLARDAYKRVKVKIQRGRDVDLVRNVRSALGDFPLMTDANADYTLAHRGVFQELDLYGLMMFEQPLGGAMLAESGELQAGLRTPVCLDESLESPADADRAAATGACRIANIKIQRVGGFSNALDLYRRARAHGFSIWVGTMPELGIGQAQGAALQTLAGCDYPTDVEASARWFRADIVEPWIEVRGGEIAMPDAPGLGYALDRASMERYRVAHAEFE